MKERKISRNEMHAIDKLSFRDAVWEGIESEKI